MEMAKNMRTTTAPADGSAPARHAAPAPFRGCETQISSFSPEKRVAALHFAARIFGVPPCEFVPRVEVLYHLPKDVPLYREYEGRDDPQQEFRLNGPVSWQQSRVVYFNGWKLNPCENRRASALVHEMAHILTGVHAGMNGQVIRDRHAYMCATEGIATLSEIVRLRDLGGEWKGFPPGLPEEYHLGFGFFASLCKLACGAGNAFRLVASNLPGSMEEIRHPELYLERATLAYATRRRVA